MIAGEEGGGVDFPSLSREIGCFVKVSLPVYRRRRRIADDCGCDRSSWWLGRGIVVVVDPRMVNGGSRSVEDD